MVDPPQGVGPSSPLLSTLTATFGADAAQALVSLVDRGVPLGEAFAMVFGNDARGAGDVDLQGLAQLFDSLPQDVQQRIVQGVDTLPPPVRDALDQLGITQPQPRSGGEGTPGADAFAQGAQAGNTQATASSAQALGNAFAAQQASPQAAAFANQQALAQPSQAERPLQDLPLPQQPGRTAEGFAGMRAQDPGQAGVMADRMNAAQLPTQAQTMPGGRPDALPAQALPAALAGATVLGNPQAAVVPAGHVGVQGPAPPGSDAAAVQARENQLAPAGHTLAGFLRGGLRRGAQAPRERPTEWLLALLPGRRRRRAEDQDESLSFQWLFWILTVVAYGAVAIAVVSLIPGDRGLGDGYGRPSTAGYALIIGAVAALASWWVGRRLSKP